MMMKVRKDSLSNTDLISSAALPFSQACGNNKWAILAVLKKELKYSKHVLEVGSGTGQHSVYFAPHLSHLQWQTSDVNANFQAIETWHSTYPAPNLHAPLTFDLEHNLLPMSSSSDIPYDAVFTANTLHIISWSLVKKLFAQVGALLLLHGKLVIYGPFNENGRYTSAGNHQFDTLLRQRDPNSGIRDKEDVVELANVHHLSLFATHEMPANNQLLVFQKLA